MQNKQKEYRSLLYIIANSCPSGCIEILKKYNGEKCTSKNPKEIEMKLARMYALSASKIDIEKDFANIHPHKNFILKNAETPKSKESDLIVSKDDGVINPIIVEKAPQNEDMKSCTCCKNTYSSADGTLTTNENVAKSNLELNIPIIALSIVGIIALTGMILYAKR